jgi:hypothetical protein
MIESKFIQKSFTNFRSANNFMKRNSENLTFANKEYSSKYKKETWSFLRSEICKIKEKKQ